MARIKEITIVKGSKFGKVTRRGSSLGTNLRTVPVIATSATSL